MTHVAPPKADILASTSVPFHVSQHRIFTGQLSHRIGMLAADTSLRDGNIDEHVNEPGERSEPVVELKYYLSCFRHGAVITLDTRLRGPVS